MRHFDFLDDESTARLFLEPPRALDRCAPVETLSAALGATLYSPATRPTLANDIARQRARGALSVVLCLEDAIADDQVAEGEANVVRQLRQCAATGQDMPLTFIRVREPGQIGRIVAGLAEHAGVLTGFVVPKFTGAERGAEFLEAIDVAARAAGVRLLVMPVLESAPIAFRETRDATLHDIRMLLDKHRETVLAVRLGVTDFCALFGIRRPAELTIYDVTPVAQIIGDIVNVMARADGSGFTVTGPVWEYFHQDERLFKPQLRESPFRGSATPALRASLIAQDMDGLIREVVLDQAHGLTGKTVIHPSHVPAVHALSVVTHEQYRDAQDVLAASVGGVMSSQYRNKMNEGKPHRAWAERTLRRAEVFGVSRPEVDYVDLLAASLHL